MTATMPARSGVRNCRLYRFYVEHPVTGETVLGYVGETVRQPFTRLMEHVEDQPWIDTVVRWEVDPRVFAGKDQVLAAEAAAIRTEKPLYNVRENEGNRYRIIPPEAIRQRRERDARQGEPRWVHPDDRGGVQQRKPVVVRRRWTRRQRRLRGSLITWLASACAGWIALVWFFDFAVWWHPAASAGAALPGLLLAWLWFGGRRARRRLRRWLR